MKRGLKFIFIATATAAFINGAYAQKLPAPDKKALVKPADSEKAAVEAIDPQQAVQFANDYFNAAQVMTADFIQTGADGRVCWTGLTYGDYTVRETAVPDWTPVGPDSYPVTVTGVPVEVDFCNQQDTVPAKITTWGAIKQLYRR